MKALAAGIALWIVPTCVCKADAVARTPGLHSRTCESFFVVSEKRVWGTMGTNKMFIEEWENVLQGFAGSYVRERVSAEVIKKRKDVDACLGYCSGWQRSNEVHPYRLERVRSQKVAGFRKMFAPAGFPARTRKTSTYKQCGIS